MRLFGLYAGNIQIDEYIRLRGYYPYQENIPILHARTLLCSISLFHHLYFSLPLFLRVFFVFIACFFFFGRGRGRFFRKCRRPDRVGKRAHGYMNETIRLRFIRRRDWFFPVNHFVWYGFFMRCVGAKETKLCCFGQSPWEAKKDTTIESFETLATRKRFRTLLGIYVTCSKVPKGQRPKVQIEKNICMTVVKRSRSNITVSVVSQYSNITIGIV